MRVLVVSTDIDRSEAAMIAGLSDAGIGITLVCGAHARHLEIVQAAGVETIRHIYRGHRDPLLRAMLRQRLRECGFDLIHVLRRKSLSNVLAVTNRTSPPIIAYRGVLDRGSPLVPSNWRGFLHPRVKRVICVSDAVRQYFIRQPFARFCYPADRYVTIHKGHDPAWYHHEGARAELRNAGIADDEPVVALAAAMRRRKGADLLIRAFDSVCMKYSAHLVLLGEFRDPRVQKAYNAAGNRTHIHLFGFREDAPRLLGAVDILALPVRRPEGFPRAVVEAMAQGVPAIVTEMPGCTELVEDSVSGIVIPPNDETALADALDRLLQDSRFRKALGATARTQVENRFHIRQTIAKTEELYHQVCENARS